MKKIAFIILVGLAIWQFFYQSAPKNNADYKPQIAAFFDMGSAASSNKPSQQGFACDSRQMCNEMSTQAEAAYFYQHCPNQQLQLDSDGTPCGKFFD
ncbi:hypothetical protein [Vibrio litoralis]|uniref:hypothetical protein n=1 Tax=Vibrio litoralis TaxID=335972 RepID=UPI0004279ABC|nr:hypothetical protein [Vibrio litoralis]